jgi:clan AA aspartic protease
MGTVYAEITLKNAGDVSYVERGDRAEKDIRAVTARAMVDTGCWTLAIGEALQDKLGLITQGLQEATLADGREVVGRVTDGVEVHWKNRKTTCQALVLPGTDEVLLGAIPLEGMDLVVDPKRQELVGAHGDRVIYRV